MNKLRYTYQLKSILIAIMAWELFFWMITGLLLFLLGLLDEGSLSRLGFRYENALWLFLLIPIFMGVYIYNLYATNTVAGRTPERIRALILSPVNSRWSFLRFMLYRNSFVFMVFALAQPVFGTRKVAGTVESMELVLCLDISNSMNTKDITKEMSRLDIAKRATIQLINNLRGEKIGVVLFAGSAFVQLPITSDYSAAKLFVNDISTDMISTQGTNIKTALTTAQTMFSEQKTSKGIILVTDGENHEEDPTQILRALDESGIVLSAFGIGTRQGGPVPQNPDRPELGFKVSPMGSTVISKVNPELIRKLASGGKGTAVISDSEFPDLSALLTQINQMKRTKLRDLQFDMKDNRFRIPLSISLVCWLLFLLSYPKTRQENA